MENQNTEWKEVWRDEYLKWVCAFANTQGGKIEIGKDDKARVVGVAESGRLLRDLPNKIRNAMGIIADVELTQENGLDIISIIVKAHPFPISYHGKYYREGKPMPFYKVKPSDLMIKFYTTSSDTNCDLNGGITDGLKDGLNETQRKILEILRESPNITTQKVGNMLGMTKRKAEYAIGKLKKLGLVERIGADKNGKWLVH